ncbi:MAG: hypothetical protein IH841_07200 [Thaumarchaeota archaeon]|nr:hypothetical protein [Nitrososphaerota archaeon]
MNKKIIIVSIISIVIPLLFVAMTSTNNVWNTPKFDVEVIKNDDGTMPVDKIVKTIYQDNYPKLTAEWFRNLDRDFVSSLRDRFSQDDMWILWNVYDNNSTNGLSEKITIRNEGLAQAEDVIIQILGTSNFKLIDYSCPEIMSPDQITKEHGKKYLIVKSRMSVQLDCEIIINSVGDVGIKQVIITAKDTHPAVWPDDEFDYYRNVIFIFNIIAYIVIGIAAYLIIYNGIKLYQEKFKKLLNN